MISLYKLATEHQALLSQLYDEETGEVNEDIEIKINELMPTTESKCISVAHWIKKREAEKREIDYLKQEIIRREAAYDKEIDKWKEYLKFNMERSKIDEVSCPYFTIRIKKNPYSTEIYDETQLPSRFMSVREVKHIVKKADKIAIKEEVLNTGKQVPGAKVEQKTKIEISLDKL